MTQHDWISLAFVLAWCGVVFCEGALFGIWLADLHYWKAKDKRDGLRPPSPDPSGHPLPSDGRGAVKEDDK